MFQDFCKIFQYLWVFENISGFNPAHKNYWNSEQIFLVKNFFQIFILEFVT